MSEMIERVARALCVDGDGRGEDDTHGGPHPMGQWLDPGEAWWTGYIVAARAAIAAMNRAPPSAVILSATDLACYEFPGEEEAGLRDAFVKGFLAAVGLSQEVPPSPTPPPPIQSATVGEGEG